MLVTAVSRAEAGHLFLAESDMGQLQGVWQGADPIEPGCQVDVEIDVPRPLSWSEIRLLQNESCGFRACEEGLSVCGLITDIDQDDGVITFMVGTALLLLDTASPPPVGIVGRVACFHADDLQIYPTGA